MIEHIEDIRLLVVDDSNVQRQHAQGLAQQLGVTAILGASDGADALRVLQQEQVDVAVIDLEMPVMDGVELIRSIAQQQLAKSVIILSSKDPVLISSVGTMAEADGLYVLGTFHKPMQPELLKCSLLRFLQDSRTQQKAVQDTALPEVTAVELSQALERNELSLAYQPKLTVQGLLLRGVEALARWHHPEKGAISPGHFIPLAERHGIIDVLTRHLLLKALKQKQMWQQHGLRFHLAFNLSPLSLADPHMADWMTQLAVDHDIHPADLTLEVTENALLGELACAIQTLARLRLKGFNIAIDDYGTGFANAQQLSRVPATELKLDRSLVDRVASRPQQRTILASTVDLARNLKLSTVAEGLETLEDFLVLSELGVDQVQGFYFSRPLPADELVVWLQQGLNQCRKALP